MSIYAALYDLNTCLADNDIDTTSVGIVLTRADFERFRNAVKTENPGEHWNQGDAFHYAGLWFLDGEAFVYAKKGAH